jgi:hypothetical protein
MKIAGFLFKIVACALLVYGISDAAPTTQRAGEKHSKHAPSNQRLTAEKKADEAVSNKIFSAGSATRPSSSNPSGVPKPGLTMNNAADRPGLFVHPPRIPTSAGASLKQTLRKGPGSAIIGGPARSTRGAAAVSGTGMVRKR